jgi:S-adenosylmethionine-diacylglycerol 3-amino-3-carboxypropyl transferase
VKKNPIQFAVVREDPALEEALLSGVEEALLVASGGCTALTLQARFPALTMTLVDPNPAQLDLVERKRQALQRGRRADLWGAFNVGHDDPQGLCACGNFESLFRGLRQFLWEFVLPPEALRALFEPGRGDEALAALFAHPYWEAAFAMFFSDALLVTMFGPDAVQHAPPGSYPAYFRGLLERGLRAPDGWNNRFLHHVFLGHYIDRSGALPPYLTSPAPAYRLALAQSTLQEVRSLGRFGFVGLSNVMDWMGPAAVADLINRLAVELRPGAVVLWRQLNNGRDLEALFGGALRFDQGLARRLQAADQSLFYSSVHVGIKL